MQQVLQSLKRGTTHLTDVPCPQLKPGHVLIQTTTSLISSGTEKMLLDFGSASLLDKIRQQPDKVNLVIDKIKTDGLLPTLSAVQHKLDQMIPMGYCNVGVVLALGHGVNEFAVGDRVVSNGHHAEIVTVAKNLCCKIPASVTDEEACFTILGAIALQGIRLAKPTLGESFAVIGLGLIGLLTVQLLQAHGCRVIGIDLHANKLSLARQFGIETIDLSQDENVVERARLFSRQRGIDGVLITATTKSSSPVHQAAEMCRQRGRIVLIGVTGLALSRADFYQKELSFQVSCSYGPGRYDPAYETQGHDYPFGFVRWTEQRNFEAFLDMLVQRKIETSALISHHFPLSDIQQAYTLLQHSTQTLGMLIHYTCPSRTTAQLLAQSVSLPNVSHATEKTISLGMIGAGNYASRVLVPALKKLPVTFKTIACSNGTSGIQLGKKYGCAEVTTDTQTIFSNPTLQAVVIASRHDTHADFVCQALQAKKHVFVEKPLCLTLVELESILQHLSPVSPLLMIGFNRRFAPHIQKIKTLLTPIQHPKFFILTVNAGEVPPEHWQQNQEIGGGRIIGEACHFIDLLRFLTGHTIQSAKMITMQDGSLTQDKASITLNFADGSVGVVHYLANGHRAFPKERLEIFVAGKILQLDNYRKLRGYGWPNFKRMNLWRQDKGQKACVQQFIHAIQHGLSSPIPLAEIIEVSKVTIELATTTKTTA